jgi:hypothetical protein
VNVTIIYATESLTVRRILKSDYPFDISSMADGESALDIPIEVYDTLDAEGLAACIAGQIGEPLHDCQCAEVDETGVVVSRCMADPDIDMPVLDETNTLQLELDAEIGDQGIPAEYPELSGKFTSGKQFDGKTIGLVTRSIPLWVFPTEET